MVFIKQRARTASVKTSGSAVPPAGRAYRSLIWARGCVRQGGNLLMNIGLCSRATAPGSTCCAYRSLIRAPGCVLRGGVPPAGRAYRSLLSTASAMEDHPSAHHLISAAFGSLLKTSSLHAYLFEFIL